MKLLRLLFIILLIACCCKLAICNDNNNNNAADTNPRLWSIARVIEWLESIGLGEYKDKFEYEAITGDVLLDLTINECESYLGITKLGHKKKLQKQLNLLKQKQFNTNSDSDSVSNKNNNLGTSTNSAPTTSSDDISIIENNNNDDNDDDVSIKQTKNKKKPKSDKKKANKQPNSTNVILTSEQEDLIASYMADALRYHQNGNLVEARKLYNSVLSINENHAKALHMLGLIIMVADKNIKLAISYLKKAIDLSPNSSDIYINLGNFYYELNDYKNASKYWDRAFSINLQEGGAMIKLKYSNMLYNEALNYYNNGNINKCETYLIKCIHLLNEAGYLLYPDNYKPPSYQPNALKLIELQSNLLHQQRFLLSDAYFHLGILYENKRDNNNNNFNYELALACYNKGLSIEKDSTDSNRENNFQISTIHKEINQYKQLLLNKLNSINIKVDNINNNKVVIGKMNEIALNKNNTLSYKKLVEYLSKSCHNNEAWQLAQLINDDKVFNSPKYKFLYNNMSDLLYNRNDLINKIDNLLLDDTLNNIWIQPNQLEWSRVKFYFAYHGLNNKQLNSNIAKLYKKMAHNLVYTAPRLIDDNNNNIPYTNYLSNNNKLKLCFVSAFLTFHPVGKTIGNYILQLDPNQFIITIVFINLQTGTDNDPLYNLLKQSVHEFVAVQPNDFAILRATVENMNADIIIFGEIGMDPTAYFLSYARLAPIQAVTFGHPDTTGVDSVDYFISHQDFDLPDKLGQQYYSEKLVRLPGIGYWNITQPPTGKPLTRISLGLPNEKIFYLITKSVQFYHPAFLNLLGKLLSINKNSFIGIVIDIGYVNRGYDAHNECQETLLDQIEARINYFNKYPNNDIDDYDNENNNNVNWIPNRNNLSGRVLFIDKGDNNYFLKLLLLADVLLQPFPLDGTTTTLEAVSLNIPTVVMASNSLGGRMAYSIYKHMKFMETVANNSQQYLDIAIKLGKDKKYNKQVRDSINQLKYENKVFQDPNAIIVYQDWLLAVAKKHKLMP